MSIKSLIQSRYISSILIFISVVFISGCGSESQTPKVNDDTPAATALDTSSTITPDKLENNTEAYWINVANTIAQHVNESLVLAQAGETKLATRKMTQAYFQQFEGSKMETALRVQISPKHMLKVEKLFGDLRKSIKANADQALLKTQAETLINAVNRDAKVLDDAGIQAELLEGM
jgi:hypothetical protein